MSEPEAIVVMVQAYLHTQMRLTAETDVTLMGRLPESALVRIVLLDAPRSASEL